MKIRTEFSGGQQIAANLAKLSTRLSKKVTRDALNAGAEPMRAEAARLAPRRPPAPDLADHVTISAAQPANRESSAVKVGPAREFYYGFFQELGTMHHAAHPFMRPAFDSNWRKSLEIIRNFFWSALQSIAFKNAKTTSTRSNPTGGGLA